MPLGRLGLSRAADWGLICMPCQPSISKPLPASRPAAAADKAPDGPSVLLVAIAALGRGDAQRGLMQMRGVCGTNVVTVAK